LASFLIIPPNYLEERWYSLNYQNATQREYNQGYFANGFPNGRASAATVVYNDKMFVFGGTSTQTLLDNSVLIYDFVKNNWTVLSYTETDVVPRARYDHTATLYNGKAYIVGGYWPIPLRKFPKQTNDFILFLLTIF